MLPRLAFAAALVLVLGATIVDVVLSGSVLAGITTGLLAGGAAVLVLGGLVTLAIAVGRWLARRIRHA